MPIYSGAVLTPICCGQRGVSIDANERSARARTLCGWRERDRREAGGDLLCGGRRLYSPHLTPFATVYHPTYIAGAGRRGWRRQNGKRYQWRRRENITRRHTIYIIITAFCAATSFQNVTTWVYRTPFLAGTDSRRKIFLLFPPHHPTLLGDVDSPRYAVLKPGASSPVFFSRAHAFLHCLYGVFSSDDSVSSRVCRRPTSWWLVWWRGLFVWFLGGRRAFNSETYADNTSHVHS